MSEAEVLSAKPEVASLQGGRRLSPSPSVSRRRVEVASPGPSPPREVGSPGPPGGAAAWAARATPSAAAVAAALARAQAQAAAAAGGGSFLPLAEALLPAGSGEDAADDAAAADELNDAGAPMRPGTDGTTFYCGRLLGKERLPKSPDGRCGPLEGAQCDDCWRAQVIGRERRQTAVPTARPEDLDELEDASHIRTANPRGRGGAGTGAGSRSRSGTPSVKTKVSKSAAGNSPQHKPRLLLGVPLVVGPASPAKGGASGSKATAATATVASASPEAISWAGRAKPSLELALGKTPSVLWPLAAASYAPPGGDYTPLPPPPALTGSHSHRPAPVTHAEAAPACFFPGAVSPHRGAPGSAALRGGEASALSPAKAAVAPESDLHPWQRHPSTAASGGIQSLTSVPRSLPSCLAAQLELCKGCTGAARVLGSGAYAVVCLVRERAAGLPRALKVVAKQPLAVRGLLEQARGEMSLQQSLRHPNIARALDAMEADDHLYMILEFAAGGTLKQLATAQHLGRLGPGQVSLFMRQVVDAVAYLHSDSIRVLHRDIKATNVLLANSEQAKLTDFGWSVRFSDHELPCGLAGTTSHMAPEVVQGFPHGTGADCWSCGVLLYEVAVGALPFADNRSSCRASYQMPALLPAAARDVVSKLLRLDPARRARAEELLEHPFLQERAKEDEAKSAPCSKIAQQTASAAVVSPPAAPLTSSSQLLHATPASPTPTATAVTPTGSWRPATATAQATPTGQVSSSSSSKANQPTTQILAPSPLAIRTRPGAATPVLSGRTPLLTAGTVPALQASVAPPNRLPQAVVWLRRPAAGAASDERSPATCGAVPFVGFAPVPAQSSGGASSGSFVPTRSPPATTITPGRSMTPVGRRPAPMVVPPSPGGMRPALVLACSQQPPSPVISRQQQVGQHIGQVPSHRHPSPQRLVSMPAPQGPIGRGGLAPSCLLGTSTASQLAAVC
ncbi:unnamed protein product, partial [Polarella glacialis]